MAKSNKHRAKSNKKTKKIRKDKDSQSVPKKVAVSKAKIEYVISLDPPKRAPSEKSHKVEKSTSKMKTIEAKKTEATKKAAVPRNTEMSGEKKKKKKQRSEASPKSSRELLHNTSSDDTEEPDMVTPKKKKSKSGSNTPLTNESITSGVRKSFSTRMNLHDKSPPKMQVLAKSENRLQAHQIQWTSNDGCAKAICHNFSPITEEEVDAMSYKKKVYALVDMYQPKELMAVYPVICIEKDIDYQTMDLNAMFVTKAKAHKTITDTLLNVVVINSEESNTSDNNR